jgi:hypothetical protein
MPENAMIGWVNHIRSGAVSAGSETTAQPAVNIQSDHGAEAWQTAGIVTSGAGAWLSIDAGTAADWRALVLARTNLTADATLRWRLGDADGDVYDSGTLPAGVVPGYGQAVHVLPQTVRRRYMRVDIDDPANPDGFIRIGLAYGGPVWQPSINIGPGSSIGREQGGTEVVTRGGQEYVKQDWQRRACDIELEALSDSEAIRDIYELDRIARAGGNVLLIPRPGSPHLARETIFGRLRETSSIGFPYQGSALRNWRGRITERL